MRIELFGGIQVLYADEGKVFTDKDDTEIGTIIYLGIYDSVENYNEVLKQ